MNYAIYQLSSIPLIFFELELKYLKEVGLLNKELNFEEAYYPPNNRGIYHLRHTKPCINRLFNHNYNDNCSKLDNLFRHKIFDLKLRCCNYRYIRKEYKIKMKELCDLYETDIRNFKISWLGMKNSNRRNFECGILSADANIVENAMEQFDSVWRGDWCKTCGRRQYCPDPIR